MGKRLRWVAAVTATALAVAAWVWGPTVLRRVDWFEVRRVEITGTRLLTPREVLAASGIARGQNVWDDRTRWTRALVAHEGIADARVTRRIPGTLRISIDEEQPVAYVEAGTLRLATADGALLPVDPLRAPVDLPIVRASWTDSAGIATGRRLLAETARLGRLDPALLADVSEVAVLGRDSGAMILSHRLADLVVPEGVDAARIAELRAVLEDVAAALRDVAPAPRLRIDVRFDDQIVVRHPTSV